MTPQGCFATYTTIPVKAVGSRPLKHLEIPSDSSGLAFAMFLPVVMACLYPFQNVKVPFISCNAAGVKGKITALRQHPFQRIQVPASKSSFKHLGAVPGASSSPCPLDHLYVTLACSPVGRSKIPIGTVRPGPLNNANMPSACSTHTRIAVPTAAVSSCPLTSAKVSALGSVRASVDAPRTVFGTRPPQDVEMP
ncbi:unnamed protein product [Laminaria digitata]